MKLSPCYAVVRKRGIASMPDQTTTMPTATAHGASRLPSVDVDSYNVELKDDEGFIGDRASKGAFRQIIENWRKPLRKAGNDPFGDEPSDEISKKKLDAAAGRGRCGSGRHHCRAPSRISRRSSRVVIRRFLKLKAWRDTERIVVGGGFRASRVGELAIGRAAVILKADKLAVDLEPNPQRPGRGRLDRRRASGAALDVRGARCHSRRSISAAPIFAPASWRST